MRDEVWDAHSFSSVITSPTKRPPPGAFSAKWVSWAGRPPTSLAYVLPSSSPSGNEDAAVVKAECETAESAVGPERSADNGHSSPNPSPIPMVASRFVPRI